MAMGSYFLGSIVKIPVTVQINGEPKTGVTPTIERLILPSGRNEAGFPRQMIATHAGSSTYYYTYKPVEKGDYIAIINIIFEGTTYTTIENFTVNDNIIRVATKNIPRAVAS
jgi:hypothetical protein